MPNNPFTQTSRFRTGLKIAATLCLLLTAGCDARYLQLAQDSFGKAAEIENRAALAPIDRTVPTTAGAVLINYMEARRNVQLALTKQASELEKDGLKPTALVLQAMIDWRLDAIQQTPANAPSTGDPCSTQNYRGCALASGAQAAALLKGQPTMTRDSFLMAIMPGLIDYNNGVRLAQAKPRDAGPYFGAALQKIGEGVTALGPDAEHATVPGDASRQLSAYGLILQGQTLRSWGRAIANAGPAAGDQRLTLTQRLACSAALLWGKGDSVVKALRSAGLKDEADATARDINFGLLRPVESCPWKT